MPRQGKVMLNPVELNLDDLNLLLRIMKDNRLHSLEDALLWALRKVGSEMRYSRFLSAKEGSSDIKIGSIAGISTTPGLSPAMKNKYLRGFDHIGIKLERY